VSTGKKKKEKNDVSGIKVADVFIGVLKSDQTLSEKPFLLSRQEMSTSNHTGAARVFSEAVQTVWPDGLTFDSLLLLRVPDAALYMTKPEEGLSVSHPKLSCVTCVAHALHGICETFICFIQM
jgi:hypothetical protein